MLSLSLLILLIPLVLQVQPSAQSILSLSNEEKNYVLHTVQQQIKSNIKPDVGKMENVVFTVKCPGRFGANYSITKSKYAVNKCKCKVSHACPANCLNTKQSLNVYCLNALLLKKDEKPEYVGAACYESKYSKENDVRQEDICGTWRYPGSEVPKFELPGDAKSLKSELLWYDPPQLETRVYAPFEDPVSNPERWPKNTVERTGFKGFGNLKPGVNPVLYLVVLRGSNKDEELLLEKEKSEYSLPQYYPKEPKVKKAFIKEKIDNITKEIGCGSESEKAFQNRKQLYKGYMVQDQNTDNAWIEGKIIQVHLDLSTCSALKPKDAGKRVWVKVQNTNTGTVQEMIRPLMYK